ncbi:MAG: hypothetical protein V4473_01335 [Patescibacteria group bacterium]
MFEIDNDRIRISGPVSRLIGDFISELQEQGTHEYQGPYTLFLSVDGGFKGVQKNTDSKYFEGNLEEKLVFVPSIENDEDKLSGCFHREMELPHLMSRWTKNFLRANK